MRIVIDTNVFISGIFFSGPPALILKAWTNKDFQVALSQEILAEYQRVAQELSSNFPSVDILPIIEMIAIHGDFVDTNGIDVTVCEDPDDNKFLECAIASNSTVIVSGDKHLLRLTGYKRINVFNPRNFVDKFLK